MSVLVHIGFAVTATVLAVGFLIAICGIRWAIRDSELPDNFWGDPE